MRSRLGLLLAGLVLAAPAYAQGGSRWDGLYAGLHFGYASSADSQSTLSGDPNIGSILVNGFPGLFGPLAPGSFPFDPESITAGGQLGYNVQLGSFVIGLEGDISNLDVDETHVDTKAGLSPVEDTTTLQTRLDWLATLRGRVGFLATPELLVFATGGAAFGKVEQSLTFTNDLPLSVFSITSGGSRIVCGTGVCLRGSQSDTAVGWTGGGGFELAVTNGISLKGEYLYVDLGDSTVTAVGTQAGTTPDVFLAAETETSLHVARVGLNIKLTPTP